MKRILLLAATTIAGALMGLGAAAWAAGDEPANTAPRPVVIQGCAELARSMATQSEFDTVYDPAQRSLTVYGFEGTYLIAVDNPQCPDNSPAVSRLMADALGTYRQAAASECASTRQLIAANPGASEIAQNGTKVDVAQLRRYADEICAVS